MSAPGRTGLIITLTNVTKYIIFYKTLERKKITNLSKQKRLNIISWAKMSYVF